MKKSRQTKRALIPSILAVIMCVAMLIGTTFAWFTDTASTSVNKIQAGKLKVGLQMKNANGEWVDAEGETLNFKKATGAPADEAVLWEPGCTYELPAIRVVNNGNLAFKYKLVVSGATGDTKLLEAIDFTVGDAPLTDMEGIILPEGKTPATGNEDTEKVHYSDENGITIRGHMKETVGNEYQGLTVSGISVTVYAEQYTYEYDSYNNTYDEKAAGIETSSPFTDYVNVTATKATTGETTIDGGNITATLPANSLADSVTNVALIKKPTANPDSVTINLGENAISTDVKIIDTTTKQVISAQGDTFFTIDIQLGQVELLKFYHKGAELTSVTSKDSLTSTGLYYYDFTSGVVTFTTKDFSAFTAKIKYSGGSGTAEHPYLLGTANDMSGLARNTEDATGSKYFKLINDITLPSSWVSIAKFTGTINGNRKMITFTGTNGLINELNKGLDSGSTIKDLTLASSTAQNPLLAVDIYCPASTQTTISGITTTGSVSGVSAMIGWVLMESTTKPTSREILIENCTNNANVNNNNGNRAVGLVGTVKGAYIEFNGCVNTGALTVTYTGEAHAAGIVGYVMRNGDNKSPILPTTVITNCSNTGSISATSTSDGRANVGGIVSTAHQGTFTITGCTNSGAISGTDAATKYQACVGGIVGRVNSTTTINGGSNSGAITATASAGGEAKAYAGAAVGYGQKNIATISDFSNTGTITPAPAN